MEIGGKGAAHGHRAVRVLIDMNLSPEWKKGFASQGWTSCPRSEIGSPSAPDTDLMAWAREENYVIFTHDLAFGALFAASGHSKPSMIQMRCEDTAPSTKGPPLIEALCLAEADLGNGTLVTADPRRTRIRILPLTQS